MGRSTDHCSVSKHISPAWRLPRKSHEQHWPPTAAFMALQSIFIYYIIYCASILLGKGEITVGLLSHMVQYKRSNHEHVERSMPLKAFEKQHKTFILCDAKHSYQSNIEPIHSTLCCEICVFVRWLLHFAFHVDLMCYRKGSNYLYISRNCILWTKFTALAPSFRFKDVGACFLISIVKQVNKRTLTTV